MLHEVIVQYIGAVCRTTSVKEAKRMFHLCVRSSRYGSGRFAGEGVTWYRDGELYREHQPEHEREQIYSQTTGIPQNGIETMQYGDKRDYRKIDLFVGSKYYGTTTWSKTLKEAKDILSRKLSIPLKSIQVAFVTME